MGAKAKDESVVKTPFFPSARGEVRKLAGITGITWPKSQDFGAIKGS
jgi:hypothetical protein